MHLSVHLFNNRNFDSNDLIEIQYYITYQFNYFLDFYERNNSDGYRKLLDEAVMAIISDMKNPIFFCKKGISRNLGDNHDLKIRLVVRSPMFISRDH